MAWRTPTVNIEPAEMNADSSVDQRGPSDGYVRTDRAQLYYRTVGEGRPRSVLTARAIEQRLYDETWRSDGYDLLPKLQALDIPTLVFH
jgi:hypothetical protein